jgi:uncharacterized membrane-anchored protein YhcB (DUF1043 family)
MYVCVFLYINVDEIVKHIGRSAMKLLKHISRSAMKLLNHKEFVQTHFEVCNEIVNPILHT